MAVIYKDQDYELTLETNTTLTDAATSNILYRKPDGTTGSIEGSVSGTTIVADVTDTINDLSGSWSFQAYVVTSGGLVYYGDAVTLNVLNTWRVPVGSCS